MKDDKKNITTQEYFYRDITSFSTKSKTVEETSWKGGGCMSKPKKEIKTENVDIFSLSVAGDSFFASMTQSDETTKGIRAMQQKLREKKSS
jgi:hypothetical protein